MSKGECPLSIEAIASVSSPHVCGWERPPTNVLQFGVHRKQIGGDSKMAAWCHAHCWGVVLKLDSYNVTMWPSDWAVPVQHEAGRSCIQGFSAWRKTAWGRLRASSKCHPQQMSVLSLTILEEYRRHYQEFDSGGDNKSLVICISKNFYALSENADKFELHMNDHILWAPRPRQEYALMAKRWKV